MASRQQLFLQSSAVKAFPARSQRGELALADRNGTGEQRYAQTAQQRTGQARADAIGHTVPVCGAHEYVQVGTGGVGACEHASELARRRTIAVQVVVLGVRVDLVVKFARKGARPRH